MKKHIQTQSEWEQLMGMKVIEFLKSELHIDLPFMSIALGTLQPAHKDEIRTFATNGTFAYYSPERMIELFQKNMKFLCRSYLHMVLHCLFFHLWMMNSRNKRLWNIACDICVEYTIDHIKKPSVQRILTYQRIQIYKELETLKGISAATIYLLLLEKDPKEISSLEREFYTDDHRFWPKKEDAQTSMSQSSQDMWQKVARQVSNQQRKGDTDQSGENILIEQIQAKKSKRSYRDFLKSFSILKEECKADMDTFDLTYYTYGLQLYKNMPLIEPVESQEVRKIQEFVIAIDTSYSTNGQLVKNFLDETYSILSEADSFFRKSRIHIIQCDDRIRTDDTIDSLEELDSFLQHFTIVGGQGTDFRPVFSYVNELIEEGILKDLSGLLYFTDGKGIYPSKRPDYKVAFLYLDDYDEQMVPVWAIRQKIDITEFMG